MKLLLKYPRIIFSREKQGYNDLRRFTNKNLIKSPDLVLLTERPIREVIYNNPTKKQTSLPSKQNVAIIPNTMLLRWNKENEILALYKNIITFLTNKHYNICIIRHSKEDLGFCHNISELVDAKSKKEFFGDYDCIELSEIISNMDFVIASRYHSLIHAYKSGVPAIVIGWAEKYPEIMSQFNQKKYYFDIRKKVDISKLMSALKDIINNLSAEEDNMNKKLKYFKQKHYNLKNVIQL